VSVHHDGLNSHVLKILPASDCAPRITSENRPKLMIPRDQGGGGYLPKTRKNPVLKPRSHRASTSSTKLFRAEIHSLTRNPTSRKGRETWGTRHPQDQKARRRTRSVPTYTCMEEVDRGGAAFYGRPVSALVGGGATGVGAGVACSGTSSGA
jgi:hypothetical protein